MKNISVSAGFALLFAALWFFDNSGILSAMIPAVIAHELGHAAALMASGAGVSSLRLDISGLRMDYIYPPCRAGEIFAACAGPGAGLLYCVLCSALGKALGSDFLLCTAGVSIALALFNLLPASPLDGGRALAAIVGPHLDMRRTERLFLVLDVAVCAGLTLAGIWCFARGYGFALISAGFWIGAYRLARYLEGRALGV